MKTTLQAARIGLSALALGAVAAQGAQFYRIAAPVATAITAASADGHITWTNSPTSATFTVQTVQSLGGQTNWVDYAQVPVTGAVTTYWVCDPNPPAGMALIPAGSFTMGDCMAPIGSHGSDLPLHTVYVSALYMDKYLVTKSLWDTVYDWAIDRGYAFDYPGSGKASTHPVQTIDWYDCLKWCNARSEKEGHVPAYYTDAGLGVPYRTGQVDPYVSWNSGYRLPTEAEWEKAARGGASGQRYPWGNTISWSQANYNASPSMWSYDVNPTNGYNPIFTDDGGWGSMPYTSPVGYFAANGYGLYDMSGNVWQWCWDWRDTYPSGSQSDPRGPASGSRRVFRGGGWTDPAPACTASSRNDYFREYTFYGLGFRTVLPPGQP